MADVQDLIKEAVSNREVELVIELWLDDTPIPKIAKYTKLTEEEIIQIIENYKNKEK